MITKTIGTGGDYATWAAFTAAVSFTTLTDNYELVLASNITLSGFTHIEQLHLNGFTFTWRRPTPVTGDPTTGFAVTLAAGVSGFLLNLFGAGTFVFSDLIFKFAGTGGTGGFTWLSVAFTDASARAASAGLEFVMKSCIGVHTNAGSTSTTQLLTNQGSTGLEKMTFFNCLLQRMDFNAAINANNRVENITKTIGTLTISKGTIRNCYAGAVSFGTNPFDHCASENASAGSSNGNISNAVGANNFVSTDPNSANFGLLKSTAPIIAAGAAPSIAGNTLGIEGNARPTLNGTVSIGGHQALLAPAPRGIVPLFVPGL